MIYGNRPAFNSPTTYLKRLLKQRAAKKKTPEIVRLEINALPEGRAIIEDAGLDDALRFADIRNIIEWICAENHQIGALAGFDGADLFLHPHRARGNERCGLQRFHGCETGFDVEFHFAMNAVAGHRLIGAHHDGNARAMHGCHRFERDSEPRFADLRSCRAWADVSKLSRECRCHLRHPTLKTFKWSLTRPHEHLKDRPSRTDVGVVGLQELERFLGLFGIRVEIAQSR